MHSKILRCLKLGFHIFVPVALVLLFGYLNSQTASHTETVLTIVPKEQTISLKEPFAVTVTLKNQNPNAFFVELNYPELDFSCKAADHATQALIVEKESSPPALVVGSPQYLKIEGNSEFKFDVYLNRYVDFLAPGNVKLNCVMNVPIHSMGANGKISYQPDSILTQQANLAFKIEKFDPKKLQRKLSSLMNSKDDIPYYRSAIITEALSFPPTSFVLKQLPEMRKTHSIRDADVINIASQSSSVEASDLIKSTLPNKDASVVRAALEELSKRKVVLEYRDLKAILQFANPWDDRIKSGVIDYISATGNRIYLPLLQGLTTDESEFIAQSAQSAIKEIQTKGK